MDTTQQPASPANPELVTLTGVHPETAELIQRLLSKRSGRLPRGFESALRGYGKPTDEVDALDADVKAAVRKAAWATAEAVVEYNAVEVPDAVVEDALNQVLADLAGEPVKAPASTTPRSWKELFKLVALTAGAVPADSIGGNEHVIAKIRELTSSSSPDIARLRQSHERAMTSLGRVFGVLLKHFDGDLDVHADVATEVERCVEELKRRAATSKQLGAADAV